MEFELLPDEVQLMILKYINPKIVGRISRVSKSLCSLCEEEELWKYYCKSRNWYNDSSESWKQYFIQMKCICEHFAPLERHGLPDLLKIGKIYEVRR